LRTCFATISQMTLTYHKSRRASLFSSSTTRETEKMLSGIWMEQDLLEEESGSSLLAEEEEEEEDVGVDETMGETPAEITEDHEETTHHRATAVGIEVMEVEEVAGGSIG